MAATMRRRTPHFQARGILRAVRAFAGAVLIAAALALLAILAGPAAAAPSVGAAAPAAAGPFDPPPTCTPLPIVDPPCGTTPPGQATSTPTAAPRTPRPTPEPTRPPTAAPTTTPTPYAEPIVGAGTPVGLPAEHSAIVITPTSDATGSSLIELAVVAMVVLGVIAGATIFLFFKVR
jgi:hypothetical protein